MFKYTKALIQHTIRQIKNTGFAISAAMQVLYISYLIYALIAKNGNLVANIILLVLSLGYLVFFLYNAQTRVEKQTKKKILIVHRYAKRTVKLYTLISMIVIVLTSETTNPITLLTIALSAIGLAVQILIDILLFVIEKRIHLFEEALQNDVEDIKQPVTKAGNFFKKLTGKEVEEKEATPNIDFLNALAEEYGTKKAEKKKSASLSEEIALSKTTDK